MPYSSKEYLNNYMKDKTTIVIEKSLKDDLVKLRATSRESYNEVIKRLINK